MDDKDATVTAIGLLTTIKGLLNPQAPRIHVAKSPSPFRIDPGINSPPPKSTDIRVTKRIDNVVLMTVRETGNENVVSSNVERDIDVRSRPFFARHRKVVSKSAVHLPYCSRIVNLWRKSHLGIILTFGRSTIGRLLRIAAIAACRVESVSQPSCIVSNKRLSISEGKN